MSKEGPSHRDSQGEVISGLVERVTFHNLETGFSVLRIKARGHRDLVVQHLAVRAQPERRSAE